MKPNLKLVDLNKKIVEDYGKYKAWYDANKAAMEAEGSRVVQMITAPSGDPAKTFEIFLNRKFRKVVRAPSP